MELRDALRMLRSEIGMTQSELAAAVNVGYSAESRWENKNARPNRASSMAILDLAKKRRASCVCLDALTGILLASRADDKEDRKLLNEVSERMKLEKRELLSSAQLKETIDNLDFAIIGHRVYDAAPGVIEQFYHNRRYAEIFGYTQAEFKTKSEENIYFGIPDESREEYLRLLGRLFGGAIGTGEFVTTLKGFRRDGSEIWLEIKAITLTRYSYGYELIISCRDVTLRLEAQREYAREAAVRDASMKRFYAAFHCDLTLDATSRYRDMESVMKGEYSGEGVDALFDALAREMPEGVDRKAFLGAFSRSELMRAYERKDCHGGVKAFNMVARRWLRYDYVLLMNPYSNHVEAAVYMYDIQSRVFAERMMRIVSDRLFEFVGLIDSQSGAFEAYFCANDAFRGAIDGKTSYAEVCGENLGRYARDGEYEAFKDAVSLEAVRAGLSSDDFYVVTLKPRDDGEAARPTKLIYTYLDDTRVNIVVAQTDIAIAGRQCC